MNLSQIDKLTKEYRPELNGLRALAVILVLLFHLEVGWMKGGFLGVDIFLVISGYFISKNILADNQGAVFSFKRFYTRRLRRLFPALVLTILLVLLGGYFLLTPAAYQRLGESSIFSALSASNIFFWSEAGYFDESASAKPLLHMWSLSLEEQFYLIWPLILLILFRFFRKYIFILILGGIILSVVCAEFYFDMDRSATFFLLPFRMFEFMCGAICVWLEWMLKQRRIKRFLHEIFFITGVLLMIGSAMLLNPDSKMPGLYSLIPCVGVMFTIVTGDTTNSNIILRNKVMEYIGKASYSIYLIHWPIIVYYKYWSLSELGLKIQILIGLGSILLGFLMWRFIENTFRYPKRNYLKFDPIWVAIPFFIVMLCVGSYNIYNSGGWVSRFTGELYLSKEEILKNRKNYWKESNSKDIILKGVEGKGHIIVLGNSHAIDIIYALRLNGFKGEITSLQTGGKCYNFGTAEKEIDTDFCSSRKRNNFKNKNWKLVNAVYVHDDWPRLDIPGFRNIIKEIRALTSAPIFIFGPKMTYKEQIPDIVRISNSVVPRIINANATKYSFRELKIEINNKLIQEFKENNYYSENNIHYVDILRVQGGSQLDDFRIVSDRDLKFLYFDASHFTEYGSKELGVKLKDKYDYLFDLDLIKN